MPAGEPVRPQVEGRSDSTRTRRFAVGLGALVATHLALAAYAATVLGPNPNEIAQLAAGVDVWRTGRFDLYRVNGPLFRLVAAVPCVLSGVPSTATPATSSEFERVEGRSGHALVVAYGGLEAAMRYVVAGRLALLPFLALGAICVALWSKELYGHLAALVAASLWCFSPLVLGWGPYICGDLPAASCAIAAGYALGRYLRFRYLHDLMLSGLALGACLAIKATCIVLPAVFALLVVPGRRSGPPGLATSWSRRAKQPGLLLAITLLTLNVVYAFEGTFTRLADYNFASRMLAGDESLPNGGNGGNRFKDALWAKVPLPLPANFVRGIDLQQVDFETPNQSYFAGRWKDGGWWYYYLAALALKQPAAASALAIVALLTAIRPRTGVPLARDEVAVLAPAAAILGLLCWQNGFSHHTRYVAPVLPFIMVWVSRGAATRRERPSAPPLVNAAGVDAASGKATPARSRLVLAGLLVVLYIGESLAAFPASVAYVNGLAGGAGRSHQWFLNGNLDWGQDIPRVRRWLIDHPDRRPVWVAQDSTQLHALPALDLGYPRPIKQYSADEPKGIRLDQGVRAPNGWYVVSVNSLFSPGNELAYLQALEPAERIGYSYYVYHLTDDDAARIDQALGVPAIGPTCTIP